MTRRLAFAWLGLALALVSMAPDANRDRDRDGEPKKPDPGVGTSYQVPFRVTNTNHFLVRVRVNGKGPFNFLVDTGAPALYIATETARRVGLTPAADDFWTAVDRLDFEGGARLTNLKARIEDPFQLVGMNALGLPGASIDGILGFTILARFRLELDPTRDRMTWTRLDFEPVEPPAPRRAPGQQPVAAEVQAMNLLGPLAKIFARMTGGKQPEDQLHPRGFLGLGLTEEAGEVRVADVLAGSPASRAGVRTGDRLVRVHDHPVASIKLARDAVAAVRPDDPVPLVVRRRGNAGTETEDLTLTLTAGEGF